MLFVQRIVFSFILVLGVAGCSTYDRMTNIGKTPELNPIHQPEPKQAPVIMPMPRPEVAEPKGYANSLWRPGARKFFKDQRAGDIGDILTVYIDIEDKATLDNKSTRSRSNTEDADLTNFLGFETQLGSILPDGVSPNNLANFGSSSGSEGSGAVDRSEAVQLTVAAIVTQVLPNGNLVVQGRQEVRVNFEVRELLVAGVVRPEDISAVNTINHTQIAEARISYGGRGHITDVQQPRYGQQFFDVVFPW